MRTWLVERGGLITLALFALYMWIAPPHVVNGDNAEFSTLGTTGGAAHPPGYPAYLMWLRLWSWLPAESPAHAAAIATGILTTLQAFVLHAACRAWGARPTAAAVVVALYTAGPIVLRVQSEAEVFAPHALICSLVLLLSATAGPLRGAWRVAALGLVAGLGISNQLTCVLLAPVGLLGAVRGVRESTRTTPLAVAAGVGGLVLGLCSYIYLLLTPDTWGSWGKLDDLGDLWWHFLRMD
ncbi:MAG: protein O-mannosyl-transferase family, partial [Kofleriaceae bacterium]